MAKNRRLIQVEDYEPFAGADTIQRILKKARETVRQKFPMIRLLAQYLDLIGAFEVVFRYKGLPG